MQLDNFNELIRLEIKIRNLRLVVNSSTLNLTIWTDQRGIEESHALFTQDEIRERATKRLKSLEQEQTKKIESLTVAEKKSLNQILDNDHSIKANSFI